MLLNATKNRLATKNTKKSLSFNEKVIEKAGKSAITAAELHFMPFVVDVIPRAFWLISFSAREAFSGTHQESYNVRVSKSRSGIED